jgi:hypothetical protein
MEQDLSSYICLSRRDHGLDHSRQCLEHGLLNAAHLLSGLPPPANRLPTRLVHTCERPANQVPESGCMVRGWRSQTRSCTVLALRFSVRARRPRAGMAQQWHAHTDHTRDWLNGQHVREWCATATYMSEHVYMSIHQCTCVRVMWSTRHAHGPHQFLSHKCGVPVPCRITLFDVSAPAAALSLSLSLSVSVHRPSSLSLPPSLSRSLSRALCCKVSTWRMSNLYIASTTDI